MISLGSLKLKNRFLLAPMSMYSDIGFRKLCEDYGCAYTFTEQIYASDFIKKTEETARKLDLFEPCGIQFLSNSAEELKKAVLMINNREHYKNLDKIKSIDLNLGCPAKEVIEKNLGAALLKNANLVESLLTTMKKHSDLPVSAKIRLGINAKHKKSKPYLRIAKAAENAGIDFITIHGRTASQMYEGSIDLDAIREAKESVSIPVVGNGNITDSESAEKMLEFCSAVMVGRQALKEPFIFGEMQGKSYIKEDEKIKCIKKYLEYADKFSIGFQHIKIHCQALLKGTDYEDYVSRLTHTRSKDEVLRMILPLIGAKP